MGKYQRTRVGKDVGKREAPHTAGGGVNMENSMEGQQKTKREIPHDPVIPLLVVYVKKRKTLI